MFLTDAEITTAAEAGVLVDGAGERIGEQLPVTDDADAGLVAGGLEAQDGGHVRFPPVVMPVILPVVVCRCAGPPP